MQHPDEIIVVVGNTEYVMKTPGAITHFCSTYLSTFGTKPPRTRQPSTKGLYSPEKSSGSESSEEQSSAESDSEERPPRKKSAIQKEKPRSSRPQKKTKPEAKKHKSSQVLLKESSRTKSKSSRHSATPKSTSKKGKKKRRSSSESASGDETPGYRKMKLSYKVRDKDDDVMVRAKKMAQKGAAHFTDVPGREKRPDEE